MWTPEWHQSLIPITDMHRSATIPSILSHPEQALHKVLQITPLNCASELYVIIPHPSLCFLILFSAQSTCAMAVFTADHNTFKPRTTYGENT